MLKAMERYGGQPAYKNLTKNASTKPKHPDRSSSYDYLVAFDSHCTAPQQVGDSGSCIKGHTHFVIEDFQVETSFDLNQYNFYGSGSNGCTTNYQTYHTSGQGGFCYTYLDTCSLTLFSWLRLL